VHLIAGGAGKRSDLSSFADAARNAVADVFLLDGTATPDLAALLVARGVPIAGRFGTMASAVGAAATAAAPGDVVLLSPACASFGLFRDEFDRGEKFREAVARIAMRTDEAARGA
jgi:UDP-N-acetylmuramoylalanine--D-glutamate ligase